MRKVVLVSVVSLLLLMMNSMGVLLSQGGVSRWQRCDVNLTVQQNSGIEVHEVALIQGVTEAAKWEAFKRYMADMTPKRAAKARPVFARLLPYAAAFGVEKQMIGSFVAAISRKL